MAAPKPIPPDTDPIDVDDIPDWVRLVEAIKAAGEPRVLNLRGQGIAVIVPIRPWPAEGAGERRAVGSGRLEVLRAAAGGWKDVDTDRLIADIYEHRGRPVEPSEEP